MVAEVHRPVDYSTLPKDEIVIIEKEISDDDG